MITLRIKDERGKLEFDVYLTVDNWNKVKGRYDVLVWQTPLKKKLRLFKNQNHLATADEIYQAKLNFWESIKPVK
jgi:hypothetical protein